MTAERAILLIVNWTRKGKMDVYSVWGKWVNTDMTGFLNHASKEYNRKIIMDSKSSSGFNPFHFEGVLLYTNTHTLTIHHRRFFSCASGNPWV